MNFSVDAEGRAEDSGFLRELSGNMLNSVLKRMKQSPHNQYVGFSRSTTGRYLNVEDDLDTFLTTEVSMRILNFKNRNDRLSVEMPWAGGWGQRRGLQGQRRHSGT